MAYVVELQKDMHYVLCKVSLLQMNAAAAEIQNTPLTSFNLKITVLAGSKKSNTSSYRPIALDNIISKTAEIVIHKYVYFSGNLSLTNSGLERTMVQTMH